MFGPPLPVDYAANIMPVAEISTIGTPLEQTVSNCFGDGGSVGAHLN